MKKLFLTLGIIAFMIGFNMSIKAEEILDEEVTYSFSINNLDYKEGNHTIKTYDYELDGIFIGDMYNIFEYEELCISYQTEEENAGIFLSNIPRSQNGYLSKDQLFIDGCYYEYGSHLSNEYIDVESYKYFYLAKPINYVVPANSIYEDSLCFNRLTITGDKYIDITTKIDNITTQGELLDINNYSSYFIVSCSYDYNVEIIEDNYSNNYNVSGNYTVKYKIESNGREEEFILNIEVFINENDNKPEIKEENAITVIDISNPLSLEEIKSYFTATDEEDGDLTDKIVFETLYDETNLEIGVYDMTISVKDSNDNESIVYLKIYVIDKDCPTIKNNVLKLGNNKLYSYDEIFNMLEATDNYDTNLSYEILNDTYSTNYNIMDTYSIEYKVYDSSENSEIYIITIEVIDVTNPIISTENITTTNKEELSIDIIKQYITVIDESEYVIDIDNTLYHESYNKAGNYPVAITVKDAYNNKSISELVITVISNEAPIIYYNNNIKLYTDTAISHKQLVEFLREISNNNYSLDSVSVIDSNYFTNSNKQGEYSATMTTTDTKGFELKESFTITVINRNKETKKKGFWTRVGLWFKSIGLSIAKFFKSIFN